MLKWTARDWTSAIAGWICAMAVFIFVPLEQPWKLVAVFLAGFVSTFIVQGGPRNRYGANRVERSRPCHRGFQFWIEQGPGPEHCRRG